MLEEKEFSFQWEIKNFNFCSQAKGYFLYSPVFKSEHFYETSWTLCLYPKGNEDSENGYMACYLNRGEDNGPSTIDCEYEIHVISSKKTIFKSEILSNTFKKNDYWGFPDFWNKSLPFNDIKEVLKLRCHITSNKENISLPLASIGKTKIGVDKYTFEWIVKKLNSNCSEVKKLPSTETSQFQISAQVPEDDVIILIRKMEGLEPQSLMCKITLLDLEGGKHDSRHALHFFEAIDASIENNTWELPIFLKKSKLNSGKEKFLKDDCFFLKCQIIISNGLKTDSIVKDLSLPCAGSEAIIEDYKRLYKERIHTNVKLLVDGQIIEVHKSILSARSPVFLAMFNADMVENETGTVTIFDLEAETVNSLLEYIYTGTVEELDYEIAIKLIIAAEI